MGPTKLWLPTLLVTCLLHHYAFVDAQIARTMRHWRHREKGTCSGSSNGLSSIHTPDRFEDLRAIYENCTRVFGNVEITFMNTSQIANRTINFLDDIEEIKGYVLIYATELVRISFKKLKIIWGDTLLADAAITSQYNGQLKVISMPNLRTVDKGAILAQDPGLCHMFSTVNRDEILNFNRSRLRSAEAHRKDCKLIRSQIKCHASCEGGCWGPGADECQIMYRTVCPAHCESEQCYLDKETNTSKCCHAQCVAGCHGPTSKECNFCTNFSQCKKPLQECRCVEQCTSLRKYNSKTGQVEHNPDGYYALDNRHCEKECPAERLVQDDVCVEHCGPGMHYDPNKGDRVCRKCDGPCPKICKFNDKLTAANIHELRNCTEVEGYIELGTEAFNVHMRANDTIRALTMDDLNTLRTVRFVSEYVYVAAANVRSLSFLENVEFIEGRKLFSARQALVISMNDHLEHLGLRKLKRIEKGDVIISMNTDLCFMDSFNWTDMVRGANNTAKITQNRDSKVCEMEDKRCHASCDPAFGCWGPSNADCRKCVHWLQDGRCVDRCNALGYFENKSTKACVHCFQECDTCKGPEPSDCLTCRNLKLYMKPGASSYEFDDDVPDEQAKPAVSHLVKDSEEETTMMPEQNTPSQSEAAASLTLLTCVPACPNSRFYVDKGECKRCHRACYDYGCDGPSNFPGNNGCKVCRYAAVLKPSNTTTIGEIERCLYNADKAHSHSVCTNNDLVNHFVQVPTHSNVEEFECAPCEDECLSCTSKGISRINNKCKCKNLVALDVPMRRGGPSSEPKALDDRCVKSCGNGMFFDNTTVDAEAEGVCRVCSPACDRFGGADQIHCTGATDMDCIKCAADHYSIRDGKELVQCVNNCTAHQMFAYNKDMSCNMVDYETRDRIHRAALYILLALFIVIVIIIGFCLYRRQRRLSKELEQEKVANNPEMPELIPMDFNGPKINREKFLLISGHELSRGAKELGRGAFGVVYAGCWMPPIGNKGKPTKVPVAIKVVRDPSGKAQSEMLDEALKMTMLRHENLLRIVGVCLSGEDLQLVTLLRPLGNLREFLQKHKGKLSGKELLAYSYQIASGMKYLTDHRVIHRDLAARNVLVKNIQHVEITDFGLAKLIDIGSDSVQVGEGKVAIKWLALEALEKQVYNTATDVWAFGVTVWEILTYGESPYANMTPMAIKDFLLCGQRLAQPNNCSTELYKILIDCWLPNPESRPTFAVIKDILYRYCRAPYVFVIDHDQNAAMELDNCSQRGLIEEILEQTDFEDPQNYFDSEPNTPGCHNTNGDLFNPIGVRRMDSLGSQRYAQDPTTRPKEFAMADDNYMVPNSHVAEIGATMYTPVVVDESGNSSLVESLGYYNEVKPGAEYINDTQALNNKKSIRNSRDDRLATMEEEDEDFGMEKESCL